jgi:phosphotransferase system HPr (HPr) family protein
MVKSSPVEVQVEVKNRLGLHLRAASTIAENARSFDANVTVIKGHHQANARSVTSLLMLGAAKGAKLKVRAEGPDARRALAVVRALFENRFGED